MRGVLTSSLVLSAASAALGAWPSLAGFLEKRDNSALLKCLRDAQLNPIVQNDTAYAADAKPFNLRFHWKPVALVYPSDANGVSAAVQCGAANNVKVNARSGGHSYAAFALGGQDGHLTVSLDNLRHLSVSNCTATENCTATIGAGNHLGDVALYLWNNGERAMAHGTCPHVGIGGHAGQGGFGLPSRAWGLLADQVQSIEIVTADGSIKTASASENANLFWAAMGAGASFGIITSFTTITHKAVNSTAFSYEFANYDAVKASKGLQEWQNFANNATSKLDVDVGLQIHIDPTPGGKPVFSVSGVYYKANKSKVDSTFAPLLQKLGTPSKSSLQEQDWITSVMNLAGVKNIDELNTTLTPDIHDTFYATSTFVSAAEPMVPAASDALMNYFYGPGANTSVQWFAIFDLYGGGDSAVTSLKSDYNAFNGRNALYSIQYYGTIPPSVPDTEGIAFIQRMKSAVESNQPNTTFSEYVNYVDSEYNATTAHKKYYPTHSDRLKMYKQQYDPNRVFYFPQDF